jgi:hypothetical protein
MVHAKFVILITASLLLSYHHQHSSFSFILAALALILASGFYAFVWKKSRCRAVRKAMRKVSSHSNMRDTMDGQQPGNEVLLGLEEAQAQAQADGEAGGRLRGGWVTGEWSSFTRRNSIADQNNTHIEIVS